MNLAQTLSLWLFPALLFAPLPTVAATLTGRVVNIADGDTMTILVGNKQHRVRLQGIDAPERKQPFGRASGRALSALVAGRQARVEYNKRDRYGRIVGTVWVRSPDMPCKLESCPMTLNVGLNQLTLGMAWWYRYYAKEQTPEQRGQYESAELEAKARKIGLWQTPAPVAPWEWRRHKRRNKNKNKQ